MKGRTPFRGLYSGSLDDRTTNFLRVWVTLQEPIGTANLPGLGPEVVSEPAFNQPQSVNFTFCRLAQLPSAEIPYIRHTHLSNTDEARRD